MYLFGVSHQKMNNIAFSLLFHPQLIIQKFIRKIVTVGSCDNSLVVHLLLKPLAADPPKKIHCDTFIKSQTRQT